MIPAGATRDPQHDSSFANALHSAVGEELPSLSCDLGEVNSTEFEQLLLQGLSDPFLLDLHHLQLEPAGTSDLLAPQSSCDLTSFFLEDVARPRDLHLSFPGEHQGRQASSLTSQLLGSSDVKPGAAPQENASTDNIHHQQPPSFFYPSPVSIPPSSSSSSSSSASVSMFDPVSTPGNVTPPHSGGVTPQNGSRAASPAWSESSGNLSCSSSSSHFVGCGSRQRSRHHSRSSVGSTASNGGGESSSTGASIPRHKRPSHKRAEIKRRDKIKGCLEDMKEAVPSLREKGKLSESAILIKAAEFIHHLKDGQSERGKKSAELQQEIECLSKEIHSFQENLPAAGLKEESMSPASLDDLHQSWLIENSENSTKFCVFSAITSKMWDSFKELVGPATTLNALSAKVQEWQTNSLALPHLRKQILAGLLSLSRQDSITMTSEGLKLEFGSSVDASSCDAKS